MSPAAWGLQLYSTYRLLMLPSAPHGQQAGHRPLLPTVLCVGAPWASAWLSKCWPSPAKCQEKPKEGVSDSFPAASEGDGSTRPPPWLWG